MTAGRGTGTPTPPVDSKAVTPPTPEQKFKDQLIILRRVGEKARIADEKGVLRIREAAYDEIKVVGAAQKMEQHARRNSPGTQLVNIQEQLKKTKKAAASAIVHLILINTLPPGTTQADLVAAINLAYTAPPLPDSPHGKLAANIIPVLNAIHGRGDAKQAINEPNPLHDLRQIGLTPRDLAEIILGTHEQLHQEKFKADADFFAAVPANSPLGGFRAELEKLETKVSAALDAPGAGGIDPMTPLLREQLLRPIYRAKHLLADAQKDACNTDPSDPLAKESIEDPIAAIKAIQAEQARIIEGFVTGRAAKAAILGLVPAPAAGTPAFHTANLISECAAAAAGTGKAAGLTDLEVGLAAGHAVQQQLQNTTHDNIAANENIAAAIGNAAADAFARAKESKKTPELQKLAAQEAAAKILQIACAEYDRQIAIAGTTPDAATKAAMKKAVSHDALTEARQYADDRIELAEGIAAGAPAPATNPPVVQPLNADAVRVHNLLSDPSGRGVRLAPPAMPVPLVGYPAVPLAAGAVATPGSLEAKIAEQKEAAKKLVSDKEITDIINNGIKQLEIINLSHHRIGLYRIQTMQGRLMGRHVVAKNLTPAQRQLMLSAANADNMELKPNETYIVLGSDSKTEHVFDKEGSGSHFYSTAGLLTFDQRAEEMSNHLAMHFSIFPDKDTIKLTQFENIEQVYVLIEAIEKFQPPRKLEFSDDVKKQIEEKMSAARYTAPANTLEGALEGLARLPGALANIPRKIAGSLRGHNYNELIEHVGTHNQQVEQKEKVENARHGGP